MSALQLSINQAQKLVVLQQRFSRGVCADNSLLASIEHMGYVQIDSISVVARAHHHSLYNRVKNYREQDLVSLQKSAQIFEYWSHAAAYLPMRDYRFSLVRKQAIKNGEQHWFKKDLKLMREVLAQVTDRGPLMAKDFSQSQVNRSGWWDWKPAKIALEQLFMQGDLMVVERRGFHKVYQLTERVLPRTVDISLPSTDQYCEHLILQYLQAHALAKTESFYYLLKGMKTSIGLQLDNLLCRGLIIQVRVGQQLYYARAGIESLLAKKISQQQVKILSPFDNLLIQRKRLRELFNFNYQIECYVPAAKRLYGYFSLPILQGQKFVARMDVKVHRKQQHMSILHLHLETEQLDRLIKPLASALQAFMAFQQVQTMELARISHRNQQVSNISLEVFKVAVLQNLAID